MFKLYVSGNIDASFPVQVHRSLGSSQRSIRLKMKCLQWPVLCEPRINSVSTSTEAGELYHGKTDAIEKGLRNLLVLNFHD